MPRIALGLGRDANYADLDNGDVLALENRRLMRQYDDVSTTLRREPQLAFCRYE